MSNEKTTGDVAVHLLAELDAAQSIDQFVTLLHRIDKNRGDLEADTAAGIAHCALSRLADLTDSSPESAAEIIVAHLLPWCAKPVDSGRKSFAGYEFRKLLKSWIYGYPQHESGPLRDKVLNDVCQKLRTDPSRELLWIVASIGYRTVEVTGLIWPLLKQNGDLSDIALGVLAGLGLPPDRRDELLDCVRDKIAAREVTSGMRIAIQELTGPHRIELATEFLKLAAQKIVANESSHEFIIDVSTVTRAVDRCETNVPAHDEIWSILRHHFKVVRGSGEYAFRCNTKATIRDYVRWLLNDENGGDREIGAYSILSRLSQLVKPQQLVGWDDVATPELTEFLQELATRDSKMTGQYATTASRLKKETWETALTAGCPSLAEWIDAAIMNETNPYVAHDVAEIIACLQVDEPPERLLEAIVSADKFDDDNGHLFRQSGFIEIARSSCSRNSFEALLHFQLIHNGAVLLSTIEAITDVAVSRIDAGDTDVVESVLEMTLPTIPKHNRDAAVSVFCNLCTKNLVAKTHVDRLREFVTREDINEYSRRKAMEAIGFFESLDSEDWSAWVRQVARDSHDDELGYRGCEALIRQTWLVIEDESWLFESLGVAESESEIRLVGKINGWQAFLIGLLFRKNANRFSLAVSEIIATSETDVVSQILDSLRFHGTACPPSVSKSLALRILTANNRASTNTEFFRVLAAISPSQLLSLAVNEEWRQWLVEARSTFCEAIRHAVRIDENIGGEAARCLEGFLRDAAFQVRRSGYRALSEVNISALETICDVWRQSTDVELRKRAVEAVGWFPADSHPDHMIAEFGFGWDAEPSVREIWKTVLLDRRQRGWANEYIVRLMSSCVDAEVPVLTEYRYGRALTKIGDDESVAKIEEFLATHEIRPNVRHCLQKVISETKENWKKATEKWPEPWSTEQGVLEELDADFLVQDGTPQPARLALWCRYRSGPSNLSEWGGVAHFSDTMGRATLPVGRQIEIAIPGRSRAFATVIASHFGSHVNAQVSFSGASTYPMATQVERCEDQTSLVDVVTRAVLDAKLSLTTGGNLEARKRIVALLEDRDLGLNLRPDLACEETALALVHLARLLPLEFGSAVVLWRVANAMLSRVGRRLGLDDEEAKTLGDLARSGEEGGLLEWLKQRVDTSTRPDTKRAGLHGTLGVFKPH